MKKLIYFKGYDHVDVYEFDPQTNERVFIKTIKNTDNILMFKNKKGQEILRLQENGDFYYKGKLIDNDKKLVQSFKMLGI